MSIKPYSPVGSTSSGGISDGGTVNTLTINDLTTTTETSSIYNGDGSVIDAANGVWQRHTLTTNQDPTFNLTSGQLVYVSIIIGANTLSYSNVTEWVGGSAPSEVGAEALFLFWSDDGSTISASYLGDVS